MKKALILLFLISAVCPCISAELYASDFIPGKDLRDEITKTVKTEMDNQNTEYKEPINSGGLVNVIKFRQEIFTEPSIYSAGNKSLENNDKECIAIVIDDSWAVASKKCRLSQGDKLGNISGTVEKASASNFRVIFLDRIYNADSYAVGNVFLLRVVNKDGNPVFAAAPKANLAFAKSANITEFVDNFKDGYFEVNRTDKHKAAHDDGQHHAWEDNFHSYYGVGRNTYEKEIKEVYKDDKTNNIIARISASFIRGKLLRAGDPLFYIKNGKRYLLGFANATNLWDNFDNTRTDRVILLTNSDTRQIWEKINSVDPKAAKRIQDNLLVK